MRSKLSELYKTVQDYESDTFSATGSRMTSKECADIVERLVIHDIQDLIDLETLDGVRLDDLLSGIREKV